MKKTLLSILAGLMVIGSAFALPTPEKRKEECLKHPEKYVWVEKTQACIPINPCLSDDKTIKEAYCMDDYNLSNYYSLPKGNISLTPAEVINIYANYIGLDCRVSESDIQKIHEVFSQYGEFDNVYVPCKGTGYLMFEFNEGLDGHVTDILCGLVQSAASTNYGGHATRCETSREGCDTIKNLIGNKIKVEYKQEQGSCHIGENDETPVNSFIWY